MTEEQKAAAAAKAAKAAEAAKKENELLAEVPGPDRREIQEGTGAEQAAAAAPAAEGDGREEIVEEERELSAPAPGRFFWGGRWRMKAQVIAFAVTGALVAGAAWAQGGAAKATAQLQPTKGSSTSGTATFTQRGNKVLVEVRPIRTYARRRARVPHSREGRLQLRRRHERGSALQSAFGKPHAPLHHRRPSCRRPACAQGGRREVTRASTVELDVITVTRWPRRASSAAD